MRKTEKGKATITATRKRDVSKVAGTAHGDTGIRLAARQELDRPREDRQRGRGYKGVKRSGGTGRLSYSSAAQW